MRLPSTTSNYTGGTLNTSSLLIIKAKIRGLAQEGQRTRKFIHKSSGNKKTGNWTLKRLIGVDARHHLIAYGLLRNISYSVIERKCRFDNRPNPEEIVRIIHANLRFTYLKKEWTLERVKPLLINEIKPAN